MGEIPARIHAALDRYLSERIPPGRFLRAVLENDLAGAVLRADPESLEGLAPLVVHLHDVVPGNAWGSPAAVSAWLKEATRG